MGFEKEKLLLLLVLSFAMIELVFGNSDLENAVTALRNNVRDALDTVDFWGKNFDKELSKVKLVADNKKVYMDSTKSELNIVKLRIDRVISSEYDIIKKLDMDLSLEDSLKGYKENITSKKVEPGKSIGEVQNLFLPLAKNALDHNNLLAPLNGYLDSTALNERIVNSYFKGEVRKFVGKNKNLFGSWADEYDQGSEINLDCIDIVNADKNNVEGMKSRKEEGIYNKTVEYKDKVISCYDEIIEKYNDSIVNTLKDIKDAAAVTPFSNTLDNYLTAMKSEQDDESRYNLVASLSKSLATDVLKKFDCLLSKLTILYVMFFDCGEGRETFDEIYSTAERKNNNLDCENKNKFVKADVNATNEAVMKQRNHQKECMRNNKDKAVLACSYWLDEKSAEDVANDIKVTVDDVNYFFNKCQPGDLSPRDKSDICTFKTGGKTLDEVKTLYKRYNQVQVKETFDGCA